LISSINIELGSTSSDNFSNGGWYTVI